MSIASCQCLCRGGCPTLSIPLLLTITGVVIDNCPYSSCGCPGSWLSSIAILLCDHAWWDWWVDIDIGSSTSSLLVEWTSLLVAGYPLLLVIDTCCSAMVCGSDICSWCCQSWCQYCLWLVTLVGVMGWWSLCLCCHHPGAISTALWFLPHVVIRGKCHSVLRLCWHQAGVLRSLTSCLTLLSAVGVCKKEVLTGCWSIMRLLVGNQWVTGLRKFWCVWLLITTHCLHWIASAMTARVIDSHCRAV